MPYRFSARSESRLEGVHPALVKVARRALELSGVDFGITEGLRTEARQKQLVEAGASRTMKSRHLTGHAIDVVAYVGKGVRWDWPLYGTIAQAMQTASVELGIPIEWGGDWKEFKDGCHFQLCRRSYP
jgi:peptidoglycan L-alanyl-D-glutamate endopeptidase CwlK